MHIHGFTLCSVSDVSLCAFHSPSTYVHLDGGAISTVNIHYLPFQVGKMQCSVIFQHDKIGDIVYSIEATATLPLPMALPFRPSSGSSRISMIAATGEWYGEIIPLVSSFEGISFALH